MGRKKIIIKRIAEDRPRQVRTSPKTTFSMRRLRFQSASLD
jgi:hypothetical protein